MAAHGAMVRKRIARCVRDHALRDDISQDVWLCVHKLRDKFRGDCAPATWIHGITTNIIASRLRNECRRLSRDDTLRGSLPVEEQPQPDELADQARTVRRLRAALSALPPMRRATVILRAVDEAPVTEVAAVTGQPVGTVKSATHYGLKLVRKCLP